MDADKTSLYIFQSKDFPGQFPDTSTTLRRPRTSRTSGGLTRTRPSSPTSPGSHHRAFRARFIQRLYWLGRGSSSRILGSSYNSLSLVPLHSFPTYITSPTNLTTLRHHRARLQGGHVRRHRTHRARLTPPGPRSPGTSPRTSPGTTPRTPALIFTRYFTCLPGLHLHHQGTTAFPHL